MKLFPLLALCALAAPLAANGPDQVRTKAGKEYAGRVVYEDAERIVLRQSSRKREFDTVDLEGYRSLHGELRLLLIWLRDAENGLDENKELALWARRSHLPGLERLFWHRALLLQPDDEEVNLALGHRRSGKNWQVRQGRGWWTFEDRVLRAADWKHGWEFETLHFKIRSNLPLAEVIGFAFDLEHLYYAYYELFRPTLPILEVLEPMVFHIHADDASFPEVAESGRSYFDPNQNVANLNSARGIDRATCLHEAVHALVHNTAIGVRGSDLPAWLDEGLAEYFRAAAEGPLGRATFELGKKDRLHFAEHGSATKPYDLKRVLNLGAGDFMSTSNTQLKYAQSYTLVDYLLESEEGALRPRFLKYLRWCYEGRGSSTHFEAALDLRLDELEQSWIAYVARGGR